VTVFVETAPHEFVANYLFNERGLFPFFAADSRGKQGDGSASGTFEYDGEQWGVTLYSQPSGIKNPGKTTPEGTRFDIETIREYRLKVRSRDDPVGQRDFNVHLTPRWPGMESKSGKKIPVPEGFGEGVNLRVSGSNIEFSDYLFLTRRAFDAVDIQADYFTNPHPYSNIQDAERYVRLHRDVSGPIHGRSGPIARLGHLLEKDRSGYRKVVQNDQNNRGETLPGFYHTVTLGQERIQEAIPGHELPKEIKHYYAKEADSLPEDHPLHHPKVGASYQVNRWDGKLDVSPESIKQLNAELEETVLGVLADAGIELRTGGGTYVEDAYFSASESDRGRELIDLNTTQIEQSQHSVVIKHLSDGLSPVEWESLQMLVTDGGQVSPADIADEYGRHPDSVRRALKRIDDLVSREYGHVSLRSNYVAELVHEAVEQAQQATQRAVEAGAKALEAAKRGIDSRTSAFIAWAAKHDINVRERGDDLTIDFGKLDADKHREQVRRLLREGLSLWETAKRDPAIYRAGTYRYHYEEATIGLKYAEAEQMTKTVGGRVWETLR